MSSTNVNVSNLTNVLYSAALVSAGVFGVSFLSKKVLKQNLELPQTLPGLVKLTAAIGTSMVLVGTLKEKNIIPTKVFPLTKE